MYTDIHVVLTKHGISYKVMHDRQIIILSSKLNNCCLKKEEVKKDVIILNMKHVKVVLFIARP